MRFRERPDPLFHRLNASVEFDRRLASHDLLGSRAHAHALHAAGVLDDGELKRMHEGLAEVARELEEGSFRFQSDDEDIHMAVERRLTEIVGPVGAKLHTGRSRNDQVATDTVLYVRERSEVAIGLVRELMGTLLGLAEDHADWAMPGYTHLQRAQPVYLGHHLLAHFWMLSRDARRFAYAREAASELPLGSGALAGLNWELDRDAVGEEVHPGERAGTERHRVARAHALVEPLDVAAELPEPRHQVVRQVDGLRALQVRLAGEAPVEMLLGALQQHLQQLDEQLLGAERVGAHEEREVGGHLVVARARGVELAADRPDQLDQPPLDRHVDVLVVRPDLERVLVDLLADRGQAALYLAQVLARDDVARGKHPGVGARLLEVVRSQPVVERHRRVQALEERVLRGGEAAQGRRSLWVTGR